jgi:zinc D-Ala-D-Ala carboxypeptidase
MNLTDVQRALNANGFPCGKPDGVLGPATKAAVSRFQTAWNNGPWLTVDGIPGPLTQAAAAKLPQLSLHFTVDELASHGNGNCYVDRRLLVALEILRNRLGMPIHVIDAYRDPAHNKAVGGAADSWHLYGLAADIPGICGWRLVAALDVFSGIGDRAGAISHVDLRHLSAKNLTPLATPEHPARWTY